MPKAKNPTTSKLTDTWGRANRKLSDKECPHCGKLYRPLKAESKYCSRPCMYANNGGHNKKEVTWWKNSSGYVEGRIWISEALQIRVKQHRWVMEGIIGRPLKDDDDVHHKNGIKDDNRPENLEVISHSNHAKHHNSDRKYRRGYALDLSDAERDARSMRAVQLRLSELGKAAIAKAEGGAA